MMKRLFAFITCFFAVIGIMSAQSTLRVEAPNVVAADEQFTVTFIIEGENSPSEFQWSQGSDFQLVWGPQTGRSTSVQIINGKRTKSSQFTYTYILMPKQSGSYTLPAATAKVKGETLSSSELAIEVVADATSSGGNASQSSGVSKSSAESLSAISEDDLFLKLTLDRTKVVVGEPVTATLKLYQRVNIAGFEDARFPAFNGFWSQEVSAPTNIEFKRESYDGKIYNTAVLRSYMLIPQQTGDITVDPAELVCLVNIRVASSGGASIFDGFFDDYRTIRKRVTTPSQTIHVSALPSGAPASFGGGVGDFNLKVRMSKDSLTTHEASSLIVTVSGKGNVSLLNAPKVKFPADFEVYDTKISEKMTPGSGGTSGSKIYEFPFIPRSHGSFTIDPVQYSYYDINSGKYVTLSSEPLSVIVSKGKSQDSPASGINVPSISRQGVKSLGEDIRYVHTKLPSFSSKGEFFISSATFKILALLILLAGVAVWFFFRNMEKRRADVAGMKTRKATKMALKRLKLADTYLRQNLYTAFYEELHKAVVGFVSDKLNMSVADFSKENISEKLLDSGVDSSLVESLIGILDACEFARYSPDSGNEAMQRHYQVAVDVISSIDSSMKPNRKIFDGMKGKKNNSITNAGMLFITFMLAFPYISSATADSYVDSLWTKATESYASGDWKSALDTYRSIDKMGLESAALYCNIGSAYFKSDEVPQAILYFEKALKIDPSYADARYNLEVATSVIQDKIDPVPEFILASWTKSLCYMLDSDAWAISALIFLSLTVAFVLVFFLSASVAARKTGFALSLVFILFSAGAFSFSVWQKNEYIRADSAIIMVPVSSVKSSPSEDGSKDLFILHEGTKINVLDSVGEWRNIELADGRQGWIRTSDMEVI